MKPAWPLLLMLVHAPMFAQQNCDTRSHPLSTPLARFEDSGDGTVTDRASKLMWMRCSAGQRWSGRGCVGDATRHSWAAAQDLARDLNQSASYFYNDWRLPKISELATITERECTDPRINLALFPDTPAGTYWSASLRAGSGTGTLAYALSFGADGVRFADKDEAFHVRLVRDAR